MATANTHEEPAFRLQAELGPKLSAEAVIYLPSSEGFKKSNLRFTDYSRPTYLAVVAPNCADDVVQTVKYCRYANLPFAPRSGHHCVTTTMGGIRGGVLIDMRTLNSMTLDRDAMTVTVGGGVITDDFVRFCQSHHLEVTVGSCPTTGLLGVSFGAGLGRLQGKYGYLHDNLVSTRLVLADGSLVTVSKEENPDLFYAVRGAGHNFGIAVQATFRAYQEANRGEHYSWDLEYELDQCEEVFTVLNAIMDEGMPSDLAVFVLWQRESEGGRKDLILINFVWSGPFAQAEPFLSRFTSVNPVLNSGRKTCTWADLPWTTYKGANRVLSKPEVWSLAPNKMMGAVSVQRFDLPTTRAFYESVRDMNKQFAGRGWFGAMFECFSHEATRKVPDDETAFPWRWGSDNFLMMTATPISMEDRVAFENHLDTWKKRWIDVSGYGRLQQYVNYGNTTATMRDPPEALYGYEPWRLERLRELKKKHDPENVFRWYQPLVEGDKA